MKLVKNLAGALLLSAWLLIHALFMVNTNLLLQKVKNGTRDIQKFIPIRLCEWRIEQTSQRCLPRTRALRR